MRIRKISRLVPPVARIKKIQPTKKHRQRLVQQQIEKKKKKPNEEDSTDRHIDDYA